MAAVGDGRLDVARRIMQLEEYRRVYWECGVEWARREGEWGVERDLLRREVGGLVERVGELEERLAEEERKRSGELRLPGEVQMGNQISHQGGGQMGAQEEGMGQGSGHGLEPDWEMLMQQQGEFEALLMPEDQRQGGTEMMGMHMDFPPSWDAQVPMMAPQELGLGNFGADDWMNAGETMNPTGGSGNRNSGNADLSNFGPG